MGAGGMELSKSRVRWKKEDTPGEVQRILFVRGIHDSYVCRKQRLASGGRKGDHALLGRTLALVGVQGVGGVEDSLGFGTVALKLKAMTVAMGDQLPRLL